MVSASSGQNGTVSVIMACHNSSRYLEEAVNSVLGQTYVDLELVLIDDCSTDDTLMLAKRFRARDPRVAIISLSQNSGPAVARNAGIQAARGKWLGILDSDDIAAPSRFEKQIRLAESSGNLVMIGSSSVTIDGRGAAIKEHRYPTLHNALVRRLLRMRALPPHSTVLYRKDAVMKVAGFNPRYVQSEDYDLWLRLSEIGRLASIDAPLVRLRRHEGNLSHSEDGLAQIRMGVIAGVCHFLRVGGHPDPSTDTAEAVWQALVSWADCRLRETGIVEARQAWVSARGEFLASGNKVFGAVRFGSRLLRSGHTQAALREKLFGLFLPEQLAKEWIGLSPPRR